MPERGPKTERSDDPAIELSVVMPCLNEAETLEICTRIGFKTPNIAFKQDN